MIKATIEEGESAEVKPKFPAVYVSRFTGLAVLFTSKLAGTVVRADKVWCIGHVATDWVSCDDSNWRRLEPGERVVLENVS